MDRRRWGPLILAAGHTVLEAAMFATGPTLLITGDQTGILSATNQMMARLRIHVT